MAKSSGSGWDDDDEDEPGDFELEQEPAEGWPDFEIPQTWDEWWDFDWESYDGEYEEFAVSADYEG
jgi:hypothetical protein